MVDVAGGGHVAVALETSNGTYVGPAHFLPVTSESLSEKRNDPSRATLLGRAVTTGKVKGRAHVLGDITMEALPQSMVYFLAASRFGGTIAKTGAGPWVYTATDSQLVHLKTTLRSLTIVIERSGIGFAYVGCQVASMKIFFEDGIPMVTYSIVGREETDSYSPGSVTDPTEVPFSADEISVKIATSSRVDIDSLEIDIDDNGEPRFNISGAEAADYVKWGEHDARASFEIDFESKADYSIWVALTTQELLLEITKGANQIISVELHAALYDSFEVGLSGMGDQVRASVELEAAYSSADTAATKIVLTSAVQITI